MCIIGQFYESRKRQSGDNPETIRGILGAYLATKYLLGQPEDGWQRVEQVYQHSDRGSFFSDLREFLQKTGYLSNSQATLSQEAIDKWTDDFFYSVNPQLSRRKLRADETEYIREWSAIKRVVPEILAYRNNGCTTNLEWLLENYDDENPRERLLVSDALDKVADSIFYSRNPQLGYRQIQPGETALRNEWLRIRRAVSLLPPCFS